MSSLTQLQLALVLATFLLAAATFWMSYASSRHVRLTRAQYLADRAPLIKPRIEACKRNGDILSATLFIENAGASAIVIRRVGIRSQNNHRPGSSRIAPERPYPMAAATVRREHGVRFYLDLPVNDDDLTVDPNEQNPLSIGVWTVHVYLSILGLPESRETWTVFARIQYEEDKFAVDLNTFSPIPDERTAREKLQDWLSRLSPRQVVARLRRRKGRH